MRMIWQQGYRVDVQYDTYNMADDVNLHVKLQIKNKYL